MRVKTDTRISLASSFTFWRSLPDPVLCLAVSQRRTWYGQTEHPDTEGCLFQADAPTELQHHSTSPTSAEQGVLSGGCISTRGAWAALTVLSVDNPS